MEMNKNVGIFGIFCLLLVGLVSAESVVTYKDVEFGKEFDVKGCSKYDFGTVETSVTSCVDIYDCYCAKVVKIENNFNSCVEIKDFKYECKGKAKVIVDCNSISYYRMTSKEDFCVVKGVYVEKTETIVEPPVVVVKSHKRHSHFFGTSPICVKYENQDWTCKYMGKVVSINFVNDFNKNQ